MADAPSTGKPALAGPQPARAGYPPGATAETAGISAREAAHQPVRPVSPWYRRVAAGLAVVRVGIGITALVAPEAAGRMWIGEGAAGSDRAVVLRALGGRDVALGTGVLLTAWRGGPLRRLVLLCALSDLTDTLSTAAAFNELPKWQRRLVVAASGGAVTAAMAVAPNLVPTAV